jgi:hypothetical protein
MVAPEEGVVPWSVRSRGVLVGRSLAPSTASCAVASSFWADVVVGVPSSEIARVVVAMHVPASQTSLSQMVPHVPQFCGSELRSVQKMAAGGAVQTERPASQSYWHWPSMQAMGPALAIGQLVSHDPQWV